MFEKNLLKDLYFCRGLQLEGFLLLEAHKILIIYVI
jgi:hypothetical protein